MTWQKRYVASEADRMYLRARGFVYVIVDNPGRVLSRHRSRRYADIILHRWSRDIACRIVDLRLPA